MKPASAYLAYDLGASSSRAILGTLEGASMRMKTLHRFTTPMITRENHLLWDVEVIWGELLEGLKKALEVAPTLKSLSVDSWGVDYVRLGRSGSPIDLPYCYRDLRTEEVMDTVYAVCPPDVIYKRTGIQFLPFNTLYQVVADKSIENDEPVIAHLSIADYYNYRFSGVGVWEASMASTTQLKAITGNTWSKAMLNDLGLDLDPWPRIVPAGSLLGPVMQASGVQAVATCSHDTGCAVAAAPAAEDGRSWAYISCGTWSLLGVERTTPIPTEEARLAGFTHEVGIDDTFRFLKNIVGLWVVQECVREWGEEASWQALTDAAAGAPSSGFLINLEDDRFIARGNMPERLAAYCESAGFQLPDDRPGIVRLVLESIAASYAGNLKRLETVTGERVEVIHLFGGGSQNQLLCQLTADATGLPVVAGPTEATALGNLLIQARTLGDLPEGHSIRSIARNSSSLNEYFPRTARPYA